MTEFYALRRRPKILWDVVAVYALMFGVGAVVTLLAAWKFVELVVFVRAWWGK